MDRLENLRKQLAEILPGVSIRGSGAAAFLFAESCGRAVEASLSDGKWWIEFWEATEDEDAAPCAEQWVVTDDAARNAIRAWLHALTPST